MVLIEHMFYYRSNVLYTFAQLQWHYDLSETEYLNYITLARCIPNEWKKKLNTPPTYPSSSIDTEQKICKLVYKTLVKNKVQNSPNIVMTHWHSQLIQSFVLFNTNTY